MCGTEASKEMYFYYNKLQDGNGFINRQELGQVMANLGENMDKEEIECLINEIVYSESAGMKNTAGSKMGFLSSPGRPVYDPF